MAVSVAAMVDASRVQDATPTTGAAQRDAYLTRARARFRLAAQAVHDNRVQMLEDKHFRASEQWDDRIRRQREAEFRPCLTVNKLPQYIRQTTNQQRENKPAILVSPIDSQADPETAEVIQGMVRHIESTSRAQIAYNTASDDQVTIGLGWIRILTEYTDPHDAGQSLVIRRVRNPFTVYLDPASQEFDGSDARWAFVVADLTLDEFKDRYGADTVGASLNDFQSIGDERADWMLEGGVRVAEAWEVTLVPDTLLILDGGDTILVSEVPSESQVDTNARGQITGLWIGDARRLVVKTREAERREVTCGIINGLTILKGNQTQTGGAAWPGSWIPLVPDIGEELDLNGKVDRRGVVRDAKDPQRRLNFAVSETTAIAGLAPKSPYVMADGQDEGHEIEWKQANLKMYSSLKYKPVSLDGQLVPPPQRNTQEPPIQAMVMLTAQADADMMSVMGKYQASLGQAGPEQSGKAVQARQRQGDIGSYHFQDNHNIAIATVGRYLVELIPKVYDAPRIVRILGADDILKTVMVQNGGPPPSPLPPGIDRVYDLGVGRYDVSVSVGPTYASKRQEFTALVPQIVQAFPQAAPVVLPMLARYMDMPFAKELSTKLQKIMPPELRDDAPAPPPPELLQKMQQLEAALQKMSTDLTAAQQTLAAKQIENASEVEQEQIVAASRIAVAEIQKSAVLQKTQAQIEAELALARIQALEADMRARRDAWMLASRSPSPPGETRG